jgi:hypothetical protein
MASSRVDLPEPFSPVKKVRRESAKVRVVREWMAGTLKG